MKLCPFCESTDLYTGTTSKGFACDGLKNKELVPTNAVTCNCCGLSGPPGLTEKQAIDNWDKLPRG